MEQTVPPRHVMILYLNTGNGHLAQARVLEQAINEVAPSVRVSLVNGFARNNRFASLIFEKFYFFACNFIPGLFPLIYDISQPRAMQSLLCGLVGLKTTRHMIQLIQKNSVTDIVSMHFALTPFARRAITRLHKKINLTVHCTDPFTGPNSWFFEKNVDYLVSSEEFRQVAITRNQIPPEKVHVMPFLLDKKFHVPVCDAEKRALRRQFGFDENRRVVLIAGGGEGLPGSMKIVNQCILHRAKFSVAVVCGRNKALLNSLRILKKTSRLDLHVYGFVNCMDSLIKLSDVVVSKAGTSSVLEVLSSHKPVIISRYIHNQELGNMRFVVNNHVGSFIRHSSQIYKKLAQMLQSDESYERAAGRFHGLDLDFDAHKTARYILEK
ncbi:MAG: hypothetical protein J1D88_03305 [Treponema sp.]|nr:hypothetical protein [Treponema sp.]